MKNLPLTTALIFLPFLLLTACSTEPMVRVTFKPYVQTDTNCYKEKGSSGTSCTTNDKGQIACFLNKCNHGDYNEKIIEPVEIMLVVVFDSRMANDPKFKESVVSFEYL